MHLKEDIVCPKPFLSAKLIIILLYQITRLSDLFGPNKYQFGPLIHIIVCVVSCTLKIGLQAGALKTSWKVSYYHIFW